MSSHWVCIGLHLHHPNCSQSGWGNATAASIQSQWGNATAQWGSTTLVAASLGVCSQPQKKIQEDLVRERMHTRSVANLSLTTQNPNLNKIRLCLVCVGMHAARNQLWGVEREGALIAASCILQREQFDLSAPEVVESWRWMSEEQELPLLRLLLRRRVWIPPASPANRTEINCFYSYTHTCTGDTADNNCEKTLAFNLKPFSRQ